MIGKNILCPKCKKDNTKKRGFRYTDNRGKIQRYFCKNCQHSFVQKDGFYRMRNAPQKITLCLDLFYRGSSTRQIQEHLQAFYPHNADHRTILRWIVKYSKMIYSYIEKLKIISGFEIQVDEMKYKTKGKETWFIDAIDTKTRFMVASEFVKSRGQNEIMQILNIAKKKTENQITKITTDGYTAYPNAIKNSFGLIQKNKYFGVKHNIVTQSREEGFNHKIERLHNNIRARTKVFRGFKNVESANAIMKGYGIFYNFVRVHQGIGKCPYELALPKLKLGVNKWFDLIQISKR